MRNKIMITVIKTKSKIIITTAYSFAEVFDSKFVVFVIKVVSSEKK